VQDALAEPAHAQFECEAFALLIEELSLFAPIPKAVPTASDATAADPRAMAHSWRDVQKVDSE
jgi:hypothetical protein